MTHAGGRPVKWKTPQDLQKAIDKYFAEIAAHNKKYPENIKHPTVTGLAIACDLTRQGLLEYCEKSNEFSDTIKKNKAIVEDYIEQRLYSSNPAGCIFNLKNNFKWKDKTETELSTPPDRPFETKDVSDKDLDARIAELSQKTGKAGITGAVGRKAKPPGKK